MPQGKRVYGKAPRVTRGPAARIFAEISSSPVHIASSGEDFDATEPQEIQKCTTKHAQSSSGQTNESDVDIAVERLRTLNVCDDKLSGVLIKDDSILGTPGTVALRERPVNETLDNPRSVRTKRSLKQTDKHVANAFRCVLPETNEEEMQNLPQKSFCGGENPRGNKGQHPSPPRTTRSNRAQSSSHLTSDCCDTVYSRHVRPLTELSNAQRLPLSFQSWSESLTSLFNVTKIAEASYGEVYRLSLKHKQSEANLAMSKSDESVFKVIALKPPPDLLGQRKSQAWKQKVAGMSDVGDVAGEVRLLRRMTPVPGFTNFRDILVLQGPLPSPFVKAWRYFNDNVKDSLFPDPGRKNTYPSDQLWAVIEMQDAGQDLENVIIDDAHMVWDAFWGVAIAVAKGEEFAAFEHRDLHLGNVCVKHTSNNERGIEIGRTLGFTGLETTIIDYTLSRARMNAQLAVIEDEILSEVEDIAHFDLSKDPVIFSGDAAEDYQYAIYRYMRNAVLYDDPLVPSMPVKGRPKGLKSKAKNILDEKAAWKNFHPVTNVVWLHFICFTLLKTMDEHTSLHPKSIQSAEEQEHAGMLLDRLRWMNDAILSLPALSKGALVLDEHMKLRSAGELVTWAVSVGWLEEDDVVGSGNGNSDLTPELDLSKLEQMALCDDEPVHKTCLRGGLGKKQASQRARM